MLIFSQKISNRLRYISNTLFTDVFEQKIKITTSTDEFNAYGGVKINYSNLKLNANLNIIPHSILFDYGIKEYKTDVQNNNNFYKIFFVTDALNNSLPFDFFAASFWLITRYEEYLNYAPDSFGRFHYKHSLAYQYGFLNKCLINLWLEKIIDLLKSNSKIELKDQKFTFISSIDIDNAYKYKHKGLIRNIAGFVRDIKKPKLFFERFKILIEKKADPFDCYSFLIEAHQHYNAEAIYFFLLGDYGVNDKNLPSSNKNFQTLIKLLTDYSMVGIHPSFASNKNFKQLQIELARLNNITHKTIRKSRQHFSMLFFPITYNSLLKAGITEDFTMGYTNINGFRASYCKPYKWYNLIEENESNLTINPFAFSYNSLAYYTKENETKLLNELIALVNEVKKHKGQLISVFHNDNFDDNTKQLYINFLKICLSKNS